MTIDEPGPVIARAPVRLGFGGGGTDLPAYADRFGGLVVSAAISRPSTAIATASADGGIGINSADYRTWLRWPPGTAPGHGEPLSLARAAAGWFVERGLLPRGVELFLAAEAPPGSGLGSSSAMAVAIIRALAAFSGQPMEAAQVAALACTVEIDLLGRPIGRQDQYASAFGGINAIAFGRHGVEVTPLTLPPGFEDTLLDSLLLLSTGRTRDSADILVRQRQATGDGSALGRLHRMKALAGDMRAALEGGDLAAFGTLLDAGWRMKRGLASGISCDAFDRLYAAAREAGALGGKIAGAGGGGFLLLCAPPPRQADVLAALAPAGLDRLVFGFDREGAQARSLAAAAPLAH